jgi:hypothetical protein
MGKMMDGRHHLNILVLVSGEREISNQASSKDLIFEKILKREAG